MTQPIGATGQVLLDPARDSDRLILVGLATDELKQMASRWARHGTVRPAEQIYRMVLERNRHDEEAIAFVAWSSGVVDPSYADILFRRLEGMRLLSVDEYLMWLSIADRLERPRQAGEIGYRMCRRHPGVEKLLAKAVPQLVALGDVDRAIELLGDVIDRELSLSDEGSDVLLNAATTLRLSGSFPQHKLFLDGVVEYLIAHGSTSTLLDGVSYLIKIGRYGEALTVMGRAHASISSRHAAYGDISAAYVGLASLFEDHDVVISVYNSLPDEKKSEQRVCFVNALIGVGRFWEARTLCDELLADEAFRSPSDVATKERYIELLQSLASVAYAMGDYDTFWSASNRFLQYRETPEINLEVRTNLHTFFAVTHPADCAAALTAVAEARAVAVTPLERFLASFAYVRVLAAVVEMLGYGRPEAAAYVQDMTVVARDLYSQHDDGQLGVAIAWPTIAYLRFVADDRFAVSALLDAVAAQSIDGGESWRGYVILALAILRSGDASAALDYGKKALALNPWDLDTRCVVAQAALQSGDYRLAIGTAEGVLRLAPGHLPARLLLAEALTVNVVEDANGGADIERLIQIAGEFTRVVVDSSQLSAYLATGAPAVGLSSNELPLELKTYAARRGVQVCIRAGRALGDANLPADRALGANGETMLAYLRSVRDTSAPRLEVLLRSVQRQRRRAVFTRRVVPLVGGALLVVAGAMSFGHGRVLQLAALVAVVGFAGIFWPRVRKITLAGVEVVIPEFGADAQRSAEFIDRLLRSPSTMPAVQSMNAFGSALLRAGGTRDGLGGGRRADNDNSASRGASAAARGASAADIAREGLTTTVPAGS